MREYSVQTRRSAVISLLLSSRDASCGLPAIHHRGRAADARGRAPAEWRVPDAAVEAVLGLQRALLLHREPEVEGAAELGGEASGEVGAKEAARSERESRPPEDAVD